MRGAGRASWSGSLAFVLAAAASAVGLGNLWRFPYLAAKYGGGVFILVYLVLSLSLGFTLLVTEIALGRYSRQSQLTAFGALGHPRWNFLGVLATVVPLVILPYYNVIGGWVVEYFVKYLSLAFSGGDFADPGSFFSSFISSGTAPLADMCVFTAVSTAVVLLGVKNGIEKANVVMMPALLAMAVALALYVSFLPGAAEGIRYYLVPDFSKCESVGKVVLGAMGQMFYSLSLAMGIMITYGSYMRRRDSVKGAAFRIVAADTFVAVVSGFMVIPIVVLFASRSGAGGDVAVDAGPGLMFETLPRIFASFGASGPWIALAFFTLVLFAALTSAISMTEACVASVCDFFRVSRRFSALAVMVWTVALGSVSACGYSRFAFWKPCGMAPLEFFDSAMNVLTPVVAALTCVFVGWALKPKRILAECRRGGERVGFKTFYVVMVKFVAPLLVLAILASEVCRIFNLGGWKI